MQIFRLGLFAILLVVNFKITAQEILSIPSTPPVNCPMEGSVSTQNPPAKYAQLQDLNRHKNRFLLPAFNDFDNSVTLGEMIGDGTKDQEKFNNSKAATIEGYVVYVSKTGSVETCNCKTTLSGYQDTHIELAENPNEAKGERTVIVEVTPRLRLKNGSSWSSSNLQKLLGKKIKVSGWLNYDVEHEPQARNIVGSACEQYSNKRQTCWEIHPITQWEELPISDTIETMEASNDADINQLQQSPISGNENLFKTNFQSSNLENKNQNNNNMGTTPITLLLIILIGAILGATGQGIRVIVGLKKAYDEALRDNKAATSIIQYQQITFSLFLGLAVGGIAGVLAAVSTDITSTFVFTKATVIAFITAGYAGTDFIEGFIKKYPVDGTGDTKTNNDLSNKAQG